ncbi:hypothetical protein ABZ816_26515 [Actinosynnema sp. NPDC047251]|uniref:Putative L-amino-acid oxidase n=1 Tax=Saccharothrix espanaensis (strain ATCC 51144 / DSM 44229 / JCM 9112 / NBRC 15066 / NRRL 15764) TaxID=1179773 RepID=K0K143_SACES|nr:hypothetical protein [Saccharothrix espanaensis]CCH32056.1 putative L-amino-acid oxidase [Saccharothrix espanaensis DSM 44229]
MITLDYCRELGIPIEPFADQNADAHLYHDAVDPRATTMRAAKADTFGYLSELPAKPTDRGALDGELSPEDKDRLLAFLESFGSIGGRAGPDPVPVRGPVDHQPGGRGGGRLPGPARRAPGGSR